jgi:hypothetical protein
MKMLMFVWLIFVESFPTMSVYETFLAFLIFKMDIPRFIKYFPYFLNGISKN